MRFVQGIEGMEEFFLRSLAARQELGVVEDQEVHLPEPSLEICHLVLSQRGDQIIHEGLTGQVGDFGHRVFFENAMPDRIDQMSLSDADGSINEERIIKFTGFGGDSERGRMGELVTRPDDKRFKGIAFDQIAAAGAGPGRPLACGCRLIGLPGREEFVLLAAVDLENNFGIRPVTFAE
jgi:hypothetical protein